MTGSKGLIHSFESLGALEGSGIRYLIFFQGCQKRCIYCHNPDTWNNTGKAYSVEEIIKKVIRYKPYFKDKGGVTLTGGECLLQKSFVLSLVKALKNEGINVVVDTAGVILSSEVLEILDLADLVIFDLKMTTEKEYQSYKTGSLEESLNFLSCLVKKQKRILIRTVIIPDINDNFAFIDRLSQILNNYSLKEIELLPYHDLGKEKYEYLKIDYALKNTKNLETEKLKLLEEYLNDKLNK